MPNDPNGATGEAVSAINRRQFMSRVSITAAALVAAGAGVKAADLVAHDAMPEPRILAAYLRWLHDEQRLLEARMDHADLWTMGMVPAGTGVDLWHYGFLMADTPAAGDGPNEAPEQRAARVLRAAGVDLDAVRVRSRWEPRPGRTNALYGRGAT